jgi:replicative DNA helicase
MANGKMNNEEWSNAVSTLRRLHTNPLWFAGRSLIRRRARINLNETALRGALDSIEKWQGEEIKQEIDSVFIDYLQRFRSDGRDWVQFYGDLTNGLKDMAGDYATRFIVGVQARREVDAKAEPIPGMEDGQWTSSIEQQSDGMISVVRPSHYKNENDEFAGVVVKGHSQMFVKVLKRKLGPENFAHWVKFQPEYNKLDELEIQNINFNGGKDV